MKLLDEHFEIAVETPDGITKLRKLILTLAMQGKLVPHDPDEEPVSELRKKIEAEKKRLVSEGKIKEQKPLPPIGEEEIPYQLPKGWEWVKLASIMVFTNGFAFESRAFQGTGVGIIKIGDISNGLISKDKMDFVDESYLSTVDEKFQVKYGDLLIAMSGATTGKLGFNKTDQLFLLNQRVGKIEPIIVEKTYLYNYLTTLVNQNLQISSGSAIPNLSTEQIMNTVFPLAPLAEQRRIVAKIDQLMALCDKLESERNERDKKRLTVHAAAMSRLLTAPDKPAFNKSWNFITKHFDELYSVNENVAELKKGILQLAVMGKLVPQDPNDQPASELLKEIEAEKKRLVKEGKIKPHKPLSPIKEEEIPYLLPKGWEWVRLDGLGIAQTGTTPPKKATENFGDFIPFIGPGNIKEEKIDYTGNGLSEIGLSRGRLIPRDSIMMVCIGGSISKAAINTIDVTCNQQINAITPFSTIMTDYLFYVMTSPGFQGDVLKLAGGSATPIINKQKWSSIPVPLAPLKEQKRIVAKVGTLMSLSAELGGSLSSAMEKRTAILDAVLARV